MEMAAAHGLAQRLAEMSALDNFSRNQEVVEFISEEDKIIKAWYIAANHQIFHKVDFFYLLRETLIFILSNSPLKEHKKKELLKVVSMYFNTFSNVLKSSSSIRKPVIDIILDPWKNTYFSWEEFFQKKLTVRDLKVQEYFYSEPEEIVMARVHVFLKEGKDDMAMTLAKNSFFFHSRFAKNFSSKYQQNLNQKKKTQGDSKSKQGTASMDWYLFILQKKKSLPFIISEMKKLSCHEGILLVQRLRQNKKIAFAFALLQILFMQELVRPSKFCCTKKIFYLWCIMHKEKKSTMEAVLLEIRKIVAMHAPSSAHFYLLVDTLWKQFGSSFITVYVELYVRGLTVDINHLEAARNGQTQDDVAYLESHIASMFAKLSTLFSDFHEGAARECMFSAFSLKPTKERLYILQSLTHSILSSEASCSSDYPSFHDCYCVIKCSGPCKIAKEYFLDHPLLTKGISNVPYSVVKDLVSVLEGVRCISFQYNLFDWHNNATDLGDYLRDFNLAKSWESDTEYASDGSNKSDNEECSTVNDPSYQSTQMEVEHLPPSAKRKSESANGRELFTSAAGENIEGPNTMYLNKKIKVQDQTVVTNEISKHILKVPDKAMHNYRTLGMEDAIENVIRMTLDSGRQNSSTTANSSGHNITLNNSLNHAKDGTENMSLPTAHTPVSDNHVYPYSLTSYGKTSNLHSNPKTVESSPSIKSSFESNQKYVTSFTSKHSTLSQALSAPVVSRKSVISPALKKSEKIVLMQQQSYKQVAQNKFYPVKTVSSAHYSVSKDISTCTVDQDKNISLYQQEALNLGSKNNQFNQARNVSNRITQTSQFVSNQTSVHMHHKSDTSSMNNVSNNQFLSNASAASSSSVPSPAHVVQSKETIAAQHAGYPSSSQFVSNLSSMYRTDSSYQLNRNSVSNTVVKRIEENVTCFQDSSLVQCDRSSVIQHTMQHLREGCMQPQSNIEIPNQLTVSLKSNAVEQIRNVPRKEITNLPPFTVNVNDRSISNSSVALSANLVIPKKIQVQSDLASQPVSSTTSVPNTETITIPGILASQSVIVSPWEQQRRNHGDYKFTKNNNAANPSSIDKRIIKNRPIVYGKQTSLRPEPKVARPPSRKISNAHALKAAPHPSHIGSALNLAPSNQNNPRTSQVSSHGVTQPTSSQPWYSEPYPKPNVGSNVSSKNMENQNCTMQQNAPATSTASQLTKHISDIISEVLQSPAHLLNNSPVSSTVSHLSKNFNSSSASSVLNNNDIYSLLNSNPCTVSKESNLYQNLTTAKLHAKNVSSFSGSNALASSSSALSDQPNSAKQLSTSTGLYTIADPQRNPHNYSRVPSREFSPCCSPSEVNPCQNCSLPAENNLVQMSNEEKLDEHQKNLRLGRIETFVPSSSEKDSNNPPQDVNPGLDKMIPDNYDALTLAAPCDSAISNKNSSDGFVHASLNVDSTLINCQYCSLPCTASDLGVHILNSHSGNLNVKNNTFGTEIDPDLMVAEDLCLKSLPLVPEQDSMFQKESFHNDLPHSKTFVNSEVNQQNSIDKNLDEIEAFSACMDLINSDKDLKMMVQGIDSFQEMGNEYLPYNPSESNFLNPNLCQEVQDFSPEAPLQNSNFNQNYDLNPFTEVPVTVKKEETDRSLNCVFDFTEKEFGQSKPLPKSFSSKPKSAPSEKSPAYTSKLSNELSFSALAEMIKETMTGDTAGLPIETVSKNMLDDPPVITEKAPKGEGEFSCPVCTKILKSQWSLKRHLKKLHPDPPIDNAEPIESPKLTNLSQSFNVTDSSNQLIKDLVSQSQNSYNDSNESLNPVLSPDIKMNFETASTSEIYSPLPKGRVKGIIKSPTVPCKLCGKVLTSLYMKKHILSQHPEQKKVEDSSSDLNTDANVSSPTQVESGNTPTLPSLLEQDIDSSTCLSVSDALKRNNTYSVADSAKFSNSNDKLADDNVKFNFNVLEFSKDTKRASSASSNLKNASLKLKQPPPDKAPKLEGVNAKHDKQESINKHSCHICPKTYAHVSGLRRHLKAVHNIMVQKSSVVPKQNKKVAKSLVTENEVKNVELQQSQFCDQSKVSDSLNESLKTGNIKAPMICSAASPVENISPAYDVASVDFKAKDRYKNKSPSVNKSLLRAVLKSNFESKQREIKDLKESAEGISLETCSQKETHVCDTLVSESNHDKQLLYPTPCSNVNNNYESVDDINLHLNSENKISTSVPLDSVSETPLAESLVACSRPVEADAKDYLSSTLPKFDNSDVKELNEIEEDLQVKYSTFPYSQNLSLQSSEISPISEIISNVSKCHFGGTSNVDSKEFFEDNSLKLLIPENQDESGNCYESTLCQPKLIELEEGKVMNTASISDKIIAGEIRESLEKSYMPELIKEQPSNDDVLKEERNNMNISLESMNSLSIYQTDVPDVIKNIEIEEQGVLNVNGCISTESANGENNRLDPSALIQHHEIDERQILGDYCVNSYGKFVLGSIKEALQSQQFKENGAQTERINCSPIVVKSIDENDEKGNIMIEGNSTNTFNESIQDNESTHISEVVKNQEIEDGKFLMEDNSSSNVSDKSTGFDDSINKDNESTHESEVVKNKEIDDGKFLVEENSSSNVSDKSTGFDDSKNSTQTLNKPASVQIHDSGGENLEDNSTNISGKSDSYFKNVHDSTVDESFKTVEEISAENSEMANINDTEKNCIKCRLCHQNLQSMEILSMHLEEVHDVPFLTKEVSSPCSSACFQEPSKLSPPKLKPNESDSESVSDLDNPFSLSKTMNSSSELDSSDNLCAIPSPLTKQNSQEEETILQNSQSKFKMSCVQLQQPEKEAELSKSESSNFPLSCTLNSDSQTVTPSPCKFITRRHSLSGCYFVFSQDKNSAIERENSFLGFKHLSLSDSKVKSTSLPNLKLSFCRDNPDTALSADSVSESSDQEKHQSGESVCFNNNGSEVDEKPGSPSLSRNVSLKWPKITIRTNFSLKTLLRSNRTSGHKLSERKNLSRSSIILSRLKSKSSKEIKKVKELKKKIKYLSRDENSEIKTVKELKKKIKHLSCHENSGNKNVKELKKKIKHLSCQENSGIKNVKELKKKIKHLSCHENSQNKNVKELKKKIKHSSCHEKSEAKSKFKPIIITLREAAEISEFLRTHKQPIVKLVRLKEENIYSAPNNQKTRPIPSKTSSAPNNQKTRSIPNKASSDYTIKKAVVKLERIPTDEIPKLVIVNQNLSPNSLSQETHITASKTQDLVNQTASISDDFSIHSQNADTSHSENSLTCKYHPLEDEEITTLSDLDTSSSSSDSVQFLEIVRKDPRSRARSRSRSARRIKKFCSSPLMKKCLVVLKRI